MREEGKIVSVAQLCRWFGVPRSTFYYRPPADAVPKPPMVDRALETKIREIIDEEPAVGLRMITARIRRAAEEPVNKKKIHRIIKLNQWQCQRRPQGHRPRAHGWVSRASQPNERRSSTATIARSLAGGCRAPASRAWPLPPSRRRCGAAGSTSRHPASS